MPKEAKILGELIWYRFNPSGRTYHIRNPRVSLKLSSGKTEEVTLLRPVLKLFFSQKEEKVPRAGLIDCVSKLKNDTTRKERHQCWGTTLRTDGIPELDNLNKIHLVCAVDKTNSEAEMIDY